MFLYTLTLYGLIFHKNHCLDFCRHYRSIYTALIETINKAKNCRNTDLQLIIYSDCDSQYVSNAWCEVTKKIQQSYSHSGYPYDNACLNQKRIA